MNTKKDFNVLKYDIYILGVCMLCDYMVYNYCNDVIPCIVVVGSSSGSVRFDSIRFGWLQISLGLKEFFQVHDLGNGNNDQYECFKECPGEYH